MNSLLAHSTRFRFAVDRIFERYWSGLAIPGCSPGTLVPFLALSVIAALGCQGESARWEFAQAKRLIEQNQSVEALKKMRNAVDRSGGHWELALPYALELAKNQDRESIAVCDRILNQKSVQDDEELLKIALRTKMDCQSRLGDFEGALTTLKTMLRERVERDEIDENALAYHRALANQELDLAIVNINQAIQSIASDWCCGERLELVDKTIVASALLARYFLDESRRDPSIESIDIAEERVQRSLAFLNQSVDRIEQKFGKHIPCESGDTSQVNLNRCTARSNLAILLTVRALILQDLKMDANGDRVRASQISKDFNNVIQNLPNEPACLNLLSIAAPVLDTRGFIRSKIYASFSELATPQLYQMAHEDLDVAIFACQIQRRALKGQLLNNVNFSVKKAIFWEQSLQRSEAVLRYHRLMLLEQSTDSYAAQLAQADRIEIEKLGFTIDHQLY